jgi:phospholipid transport system transporter-binding protein
MRITQDSITNRNAAAIVAAGSAAIDAGDASIDFSAVRRCDTAAVACVLAWIRSAQARGKTLALVAVPADLVSLAKLYGVDLLIAGAAGAGVPGAATLPATLQ